MRSRYTASAVGDRAYLLSTWHPSTRPPVLELAAGQRWTGAGGTGSEPERSRIRRDEGQWYQAPTFCFTNP